jgi:hypothetical protein
MLRKIWLIILSSLLLGGAVLCTIRWKAWFGNPPEPKWEGDTIQVSFNTFANEQTLQRLQKDTLQFILFGDIHNGVDSSDFALLAARCPNIDFYAQLGDWMERPYFYYEQMLYHAIVGTGFDTLPVIAVPGNHEHRKGIIKHLPAHWKTIFPNPTNGPARFSGTTYLVDFPHLRILTINTDGLQRLSDYTRVGFWLKQSLINAKDKHTIVLMHHPVFSTAQGRQNPLIWLSFYGILREADIVFSGHDHNYARRIVEYKERFWVKQQPTLFIGTNASKKMYAVKENVNYECSFSGEPVYEYVVVTQDTLSVRTYKLHSGELIDEVKIPQ